MSEVLLESDPSVAQELAGAAGDVDTIRATVAAHPESSLAWAALAMATFDQYDALDSYAYARVGYHRGLEALSDAGWTGHESIPWSHAGNRGVLRSIYALRMAAAALGESGEVEWLGELLHDADPTAEQRIESSHTSPIQVQSGYDGRNPNPPTEAIVIRGED